MKASIVGAGASILATLGIILSGCGPHSFRQATCVDQTDDCNRSVVVVRNDTPRTVVLQPCMHHCAPIPPYCVGGLL